MKGILGITRRLMLVLLVLVAGSMMLLSSPAIAATDTEAYFVFQSSPYENEDFTIKLTDPNKIQEARDILSGKQNDKTHVMGRIIKSPAPYNSKWDYQLDPSSIGFFAFAIEVCDATASYVNDHLDEVGGAFLPGNYWCPWSSKLVKEVSNEA